MLVGWVWGDSFCFFMFFCLFFWLLDASYRDHWKGLAKRILPTVESVPPQNKMNLKK